MRLIIAGSRDISPTEALPWIEQWCALAKPAVTHVLGGGAEDRAAFIAAFSQHGRITGKPARRAKRPTQTQLDLLDLIGGEQ